MKFSILVLDDEKNIREGLQMALEDEGYEVFTAEDGNTGVEIALKGDIDLIITDLKMPRMSGELVLQHVHAVLPDIPIIILTGHGTVENAVEAMHKGAYDFLTKPLDLNRLSLLVRRALQNRELIVQHRELIKQIGNRTSFENIVGESPAMNKVFDMVKKAAASKASVLITGESGVGKELIANAIHNLSPRKAKPLIKVHCASFAEGVLESELFGHERGAFTGAVNRMKGRFELAHEGSMFLDEIGEVSMAVQIKLLRVLQERSFERVGGRETIKVDVRVISATNRNLLEEIKRNLFREDLYYRLNVVHIHVPALRERKEDLPLLIATFLKEIAEENGKKITSIDPQAQSALHAYDWPGNIRQLRNCIESAVIMSSGPVIHIEDLSEPIRSLGETSSIRIPIGVSMEDAEKEIILQTLEAQKGNKSKTADVLGIGRKTLYLKLDQYTNT
ncbi:sigma-54 dependent transcriptional regulator, partial [Treponema pallidum]